MATYKELCNQVAADSGTFSEGDIAAVTGQTGRKAKIVRWTNMAWRSIQNAHKAWRWMQSEFSLSTVIDQQRYAGTAATDSIASAAITRFSEWDCRGLGEDRFKLYDSTIGLSDGGALQFIPWDEFYPLYVNTGADSAKPSKFSIDPANKLCLASVPDSADYRVIGPYRKSAQALAADADVPEMPADMHDVIASVAVQFLSEHDEALQLIPLWKMRENRDFCRLEAMQLPQIRLGGPLA